MFLDASSIFETNKMVFEFLKYLENGSFSEF